MIQALLAMLLFSSSSGRAESGRPHFEFCKAIFFYDSLPAEMKEDMEAALAQGRDSNEACSDGALPLQHAVDRNSLAAAQLLVEHGAFIHKTDARGVDVFHYAVAKGSPELIRFFVDKGALVSSKGNPGDGRRVNAVTILAGRGRLDLLKYFLDKGVEPEADSLPAAAQGESLDAVKLLLEHGAPASPQALAAAAGKGNLAITKLLLEHGANVDEFVSRVLLADVDPQIVKVLLERGADPNVVGIRDDRGLGERPLMPAIFLKRTRVVALLLDGGADPNAMGASLGWDPDRAGEPYYDVRKGSWTALMWAVAMDDQDSVRLLLNHSADRSLVNEQGWTALDLARAGEKSRWVRSGMARLLEEWKGPAASSTAKGPAPVSDADAPSYALAEDPDAFAVVVGVEKYGGGLPAATFAERDAAAVRAHLISLGFPTKHIAALIGAEASRAAMVKELEVWLGKNVNDRSTVVFYYSGHGAPDPKTGQAFLVPSDGDPEYLEQTAYPLKRLYAQLGALKAKRVLVVLDSCFSGSGPRSVLAPGIRPLVNRVASDAAPEGKVVALTASGPSEISGSLPEQGHGVFTYFLLKGLNGAAAGKGGVTVRSLHDYLKGKVEEEARLHNRDQTPQLGPADRASAWVLRP